MAETLVIRLAERLEAPASWILIDSVGNLSGQARTGSLSAAAALAAGRRVVVLVPAVSVLLSEPQLPVRSGARLAQVVPFALEEQLADDLEDVHFAVGRREGERLGTPVAAVTRARMDEWLAALRAVQIEALAFYADCSLLPDNPSHTVVMIEGDRLYVRHPRQQPFVLDMQPLATALDLAAVGSDTQHVIVYINEEDWEREQTLFEAMRERVASLHVQLLPENALSLLARQVQTLAPINLLQGHYAPRSQLTGSWRRWRLAALLLLSLVALNLLGKGLELWQLRRAERSLDAAIEQTFREAMPGEQNTLNARRRMEARLAAAHGGGLAGDGILPMLGAISKAFAQVPEAKIEALSYRNEVLDLKIAARDVNSLSQLENLVAQNGMSAQLQSSSSSGSGVEGRVQIRAGK